MNLIALIWNLFLAFASYFICRIAYIWQNWSIIGAGIEELDLGRAFAGSLLFDNAAICYTLGLYVLMMLLPLPVRAKGWYQAICKWYFVIVGGISILFNLADSVYFPYAGRRTTTATLLEFQNESAGNIFKICIIEVVHNWYLLLLAAALIAALALLYKKGGCHKHREVMQVCAELVLFLGAIPLIYAGIRGGFSRQTRPININYAMRYVDTPARAAAILNSTFPLIRNFGQVGYTRENFMPEDELATIYSAVHGPCEASYPGNPNIFIIIVESLSQEFIGAYNNYPCHTPFLDYLRSVSLSPRQAFANGNKSIDALPSILSSLPRVEEHLLLSPYANNRFSSVVLELAQKGYSSAFFHGASAGSMGFDAFASAAGVQKFYSYEDYCKDKRFAGSRDFDGHWAVWDEEFLQYTALHAADVSEPFIHTVFTASSHHPFEVPDRYKERFNLPGHPMYNCVSYTDYSLRRFFETASQQPWYDNTVFVITADHVSSLVERPEYLQDKWGRYRVPIIIFDPSGTLPRGEVETISQQIDIFPTIMGITGATRDYVAFGKDFLSENSASWAYIYKEEHSVVGADSVFMKALIQDYKSRMIDDRMRIFD